MLTWEDIEHLRDQTFRRTPHLRIKTLDDAEAFVNQSGFCFAFKMVNSELPCMWHAAVGERHPKYPHHVQHDPYIGLVWKTKDVLAAERKVYYGKALKKRPTFISLDYLPPFYRLRRLLDPKDYIAEYLGGNLSSQARKIMDVLSEASPKITVDLKLAARMAHPHKRAAFDKAMAELQHKMYVVKIGEFYNPFTFLWDLVDHRYESEIHIAKTITARQARRTLLLQYFRLVWISSVREIRRLFEWNESEVTECLSTLQQDNKIKNDIEIKDEKYPFYGVSELK